DYYCAVWDNSLSSPLF
nr:immunoglobulin light chain junction region [Macaca mulatta]MOW06414.1 immunoglobulin light chain junction region [Macaca mulatta]MOW07052.1 immunoglobulin light chain junction region [Macaca mulatta]MOW67965.1 immunoglobulin light chain junction region [Macaca mulatta]MOW68082.1 immunoglobulin light chain junction region [Macaca mulatta]